MRHPRALLARSAIAVALLPLSFATKAAGKPPSIVLLTLDTTRADALSCYGNGKARTPVLDGLAARGVRYTRVLTPCPLTLVAHASLLTGRLPTEHGVHDNGTAVLPRELPTLADRLKARGYVTAAFVASRVLDRRFGLDRGFDVYDDHMAAENLGEYGYPERDAAAVTDAALGWLRAQSADRPFFLWVHYYDAHAPYAPPPDLGGATKEAQYAGEIAYVDREIGRLLTALPGDAAKALVAAVADHGEALGDHGERSHGILLYRSTLEVPLIVAGPTVPPGKTVDDLSSSRHLAATLLALSGDAEGARLLGGPLALPGRASATSRDGADGVYGETQMPASAYGWSPLVSWTEGRYKLIVAPHPELYDLVVDPGERTNLYQGKHAEALGLETALRTFQKSLRAVHAAKPAPDAELKESLASLGYLGGASGGKATAIDPKDGLPMLSELEAAKGLISAKPKEAMKALADLVRRSPGNVPFLTELARAQLASGEGAAAVASYQKAIELNPQSEFTYLGLGDALGELGRFEEARATYQRTLELDPRFAAAWMRMAQLAQKAGRKDEIRATLGAAVSMGCDSASLLTWLAQTELSAGEGAAGENHVKEALRLSPQFVPAWILGGERQEELGLLEGARSSFQRAASIDPHSSLAFLHLGKVLLKLNSVDGARAALKAVKDAEPGSQNAAEADLILAGIR